MLKMKWKKMILIEIMMLVMMMIILVQAQTEANPNLITTPYEVDFKKSGGDFNLTYFVLDSKENRITIPFNVSYENTDKFGFGFIKEDIQSELANGLEVFDYKIYYEIKSDKTYIESTNPYMLERPLGYKKNTTN